jgi:hypothetical protein
MLLIGGLSGISGLSGLSALGGGGGSSPPPDVILLSDQFHVAGPFTGTADSGQQQYTVDGSFEISDDALKLAELGMATGMAVGKWAQLAASDYTMVSVVDVFYSAEMNIYLNCNFAMTDGWRAVLSSDDGFVLFKMNGEGDLVGTFYGSSGTTGPNGQSIQWCIVKSGSSLKMAYCDTGGGRFKMYEFTLDAFQTLKTAGVAIGSPGDGTQLMQGIDVASTVAVTPNAVGNLAVVDTGTNYLTITWDSPSANSSSIDNGHPSITLPLYYRVFIKKSSDSVWLEWSDTDNSQYVDSGVDGGGTSITQPGFYGTGGLEGSTSYDIKVVAGNVMGDGAESIVTASTQTLWTPGSLPSLYAWWDADHYTVSSGTSVNQHTDRSGNGRHLVPIATAQDVIANQVNGKAVFRISTGGGAKTSQSNLSTTKLYILATFKPAAGIGATARLFDWTAYNTGCWMGIGSPDTARGGGVKWQTGSPYGNFVTGTNAAWQMLGMLRNTANNPGLGGANGVQAAWLNGDFDNAAGSNPSDATALSAGSMCVGSDQGNGSYITNTDWRCVVVCNDVLSQSDRQKLEGYMMWDIGLQASLPQGHPYRNAPPGV